MIFTNARLIFPDGIRDGLEIVVEEGKIAAICERSLAHREHDVIDLNGNYLAPGFIDLHVHGALGRDTMEASAEAFRSICNFHASGGTTSLLLTTATAPLNEIVKVSERNAPNSFRSRQRLLFGSCSNTRTCSSVRRSRQSCLERLKRSKSSMLMGSA